MRKARNVAAVLSVGGTIWLVIGLISLFGLHLDRPGAAIFFVIGFLPALAVYVGWTLRAFDRFPARNPDVLWIPSIAITISYLLLFHPLPNLVFSSTLHMLIVVSLVVAVGLSIKGLLSDKRVVVRSPVATQPPQPPAQSAPALRTAGSPSL